jgi:hypothetical protein
MQFNSFKEKGRGLERIERGAKMNECREGRSEKERERKRKKENMSMSCFLSNIMLTKLLLVSFKNNILGLCNSVSLATSVLGEPLHSICQCFVWGILSLFLTPSASSTKENRVRNGIQMYGQEKQRQQQQNNKTNGAFCFHYIHLLRVP